MLLSQYNMDCLQAALVTNPGTSFFPWNCSDFPTAQFPQGIPRSAVLAAYLLLAGASAGPNPGSALGLAGNYAILAAAGITNTGATVISGGVIGSYPTPSITGFPPGVATIDNADAQAAQGAALTAYLAYQALPYTSLSASSANLSVLGNGATASTYLPGNYSAGSSMDIPTSITLDAQGNANALFVFKAGSTVTLESTASVLLVNGAQANNVIWIVGSSFTSVTPSVMVGNILANTSITLGGGSLAGRALAGIIATSGAVTIAAAMLITAPSSSGGTVTNGGNFIYAPGIYSSAVLNIVGTPNVSQTEQNVPGVPPSMPGALAMPIVVNPIGAQPFDGLTDFVTQANQVR